MWWNAATRAQSHTCTWGYHSEIWLIKCMLSKCEKANNTQSIPYVKSMNELVFGQ